MARSRLNQVSDIFYRAGRVTRNARAVERAIETGSPGPIFARLLRIYLGRSLGRAQRKIRL